MRPSGFQLVAHPGNSPPLVKYFTQQPRKNAIILVRVILQVVPAEPFKEGRPHRTLDQKFGM
jgi:hypothetical protein